MIEWVDVEKVYPRLRHGLPRLVPERVRLELHEALAAHGFTIYQPDGSRITDTSSFFQEVAQALQFPAYFGHNWDAFIDCLGEFEDRPARRVAIIWRRADHTERENLGLLLEAVHWFLTVARDLGTYRADGAAPTQMELFLAGRGRQYEMLSRRTYPTDLPDDEWQQIAARVRATGRAARLPDRELREILNGIRYKVRCNCPWDKLPPDLPPERTLRRYYHQWERDGLLPLVLSHSQ